jgi:hydrogenase 3 maturation protease
MSYGSWQTELQQALTQATPTDRGIRVAVVGVGHALRGDDAVGLAVAQHLRPAYGRWLVLVGGSAPENCTGPLRRFGPDFVVLVDAADLHARPGSIQWLECGQIDGLSATTHTLPLGVVAAYLTAELGCTVGVLAIQPAASNDIGAPLSPEVNRAARQLARVLSALSGRSGAGR